MTAKYVLEECPTYEEQRGILGCRHGASTLTAQHAE